MNIDKEKSTRIAGAIAAIIAILPQLLLAFDITWGPEQTALINEAWAAFITLVASISALAGRKIMLNDAKEKKSLLKSQTLWGTLAMGIPAALSLAGVPLGAAQLLTETIGATLTSTGFLRAEKDITIK